MKPCNLVEHLNNLILAYGNLPTGTMMPAAAFVIVLEQLRSTSMAKSNAQKMWTPERKASHAEHMKQRWAEKKQTT